MSNITEILSKFFHENTWAHWEKYRTSKALTYEKSGCFVDSFGIDDYLIDIRYRTEDIERWLRQMNTDYEDLSEKEKDSDRNIADEFNNFLKEYGYKIVRIEE